MTNPFLDFRSSIPYRKKEIPLGRIVRAKQEIKGCIVEGYLRLVKEEVKDLVFWLVEQRRVAKAYEEAVKSIRDLQYDQDDIEEFCAELDSSNKIPYIIAGPAGIYLSALVNLSQEDCITLRLEDYQRRFHFLGYRLPEGKTLILQGDVGDFIGAGLAGGRLMVEGSSGNWCGAWMVKGEILVAGHTGEKTGECMRGGEIHVDGQIRGIRKTCFGGTIYRRGKLANCVFPSMPLSTSFRDRSIAAESSSSPGILVNIFE